MLRFATKEKLKTLLASNKATLVDMRSPVQFRDDPISGAVNLPLRNLVNSLVLMKDKKKPLILFGIDPKDSDVKTGVTYAENLCFENIYVTDLKQLK